MNHNEDKPDDLQPPAVSGEAMGSQSPGSDADTIPLADPPPPPPPPAELRQPGGYPMARPAGGPRIDAPSVMTPDDGRCPRCGARLGENDVVCVACGYDLQANTIREPEVGSVEIDDSPGRPVFLIDRPGTTKPLLVAGGVLTLLAMIVGGITAGQIGGSGYVLLRVGLVLYFVLLHSATGAGAVIASAWLTNHRLGSLEQGAVRMFVTVAAFVLIIQTPNFGLHVWVAGGLRWIVAAAAYFGLLFVLFKRDRHETGVLAGSHAILWLLTSIGMHLAVWIKSVQPAVQP